MVRWLSSGIGHQHSLAYPIKAGSPGFLDLRWHLIAVWESVSRQCESPTVPAAVDMQTAWTVL